MTKTSRCSSMARCSIGKLVNRMGLAIVDGQLTNTCLTLLKSHAIGVWQYGEFRRNWRLRPRTPVERL